jgi:uncharacterized DUF497 family protein
VQIHELQWDDSNVAHIARHDISPDEVEDVCFSLHIRERSENKKYILSGQTSNGRYLHVVLAGADKGLFRPITAFEMSDNDKRSYRKRLKQ